MVSGTFRHPWQTGQRRMALGSPGSLAAGGAPVMTTLAERAAVTPDESQLGVRADLPDVMHTARRFARAVSAEFILRGGEEQGAESLPGGVVPAARGAAAPVVVAAAAFFRLIGAMGVLRAIAEPYESAASGGRTGP